MDLSIFDFNALASFIGSIMSFFSVIIALYTLSTAFRFRSELGLSEQISNVPEILKKDYVDRKFDNKLTINDEEISNLKEARVIIQEQIKPHDGKTEEDARVSFLESTLSLDTWQNKFAYEASLGIESVGLMILSGAIPANLVFEDAALVIIEDWGYCSKLVNERIRQRPDALIPKSQENADWIGLNRGHGEWLVYASAIYLSKHWEGEYLDKLLKYIGDLEIIKYREHVLRNFYSDIIPRATRKNIEKFIK